MRLEKPGPGLRFQRRHRMRLQRLPRHLTSSGQMSPQKYEMGCSCGWVGPVQQSSFMVSAAFMDHVWEAWRRSEGYDD